AEQLGASISRIRTNILADTVAEQAAENPGGRVFAVAGGLHLLNKRAGSVDVGINEGLRERLETEHSDLRYMVARQTNPPKAAPEDVEERIRQMKQRTDGLSEQALQEALQQGQWPQEAAQYLTESEMELCRRLWGEPPTPNVAEA